MENLRDEPFVENLRFEICIVLTYPSRGGEEASATIMAWLLAMLSRECPLGALPRGDAWGSPAGALTFQASEAIQGHSMRRHVPLLTLLVLCLASPALAQFETASVVGTVRDASGGIVADAKVTLTNTQTGVSVERMSDANGSFEFFTVQVGHLCVVCGKDGFLHRAGRERPGDGRRTPARRADHGGRAGERDRGGKRPLPCCCRPTRAIAARSSPVRRLGRCRSMAVSTRSWPCCRRAFAFRRWPPGGREGSFNVNGLRSTFNNFLIDGVDNNAYGTSNQGFSNQVMQPSPDSLEEFRVVTNNMSAEYGRAAGATINVAYASGTNQFRGSAWEFARRTESQRDRLLSTARRRKATVRARSVWRRHRRADHPKNRAFFFADFEGFKQTRGVTASTTIANLAQRAGILTVDVRNPLTGAVYPGGHAQFR